MVVSPKVSILLLSVAAGAAALVVAVVEDLVPTMVCPYTVVHMWFLMASGMAAVAISRTLSTSSTGPLAAVTEVLVLED